GTGNTGSPPRGTRGSVRVADADTDAPVPQWRSVPFLGPLQGARAGGDHPADLRSVQVGAGDRAGGSRSVQADRTVSSSPYVRLAPPVRAAACAATCASSTRRISLSSSRPGSGRS